MQEDQKKKWLPGCGEKYEGCERFKFEKKE